MPPEGRWTERHKLMSFYPSDEVRAWIDEEVRRLVNAAHEEVVELLRENRDKLDSLAEALLEHETLDQEDAYAAAGVTPSARAEEPLAAR